MKALELNEFVISPETSIFDAMNKIDKNAKGIVYVVAENMELLGAVTDGNIRRYILKNQTISGLVKDVMNDTPVYVNKKAAHQATQVMQEAKITSVPIVDDYMKVQYIAFRTGEKFYNEMELDVPVVIMAGGKGTRLYPYTQVLPKPLIPIGEKTITEHIMEHFEQFGCGRFSMIVNYKKEFIKAYISEISENVKFIEEKTFLGTAGGLKLLENEISETFFMTNCDILIEENYGEILKYHKENKNIITLVGALKREVIPYGTLIADESGQLKELAEKPTFEFLTNTGLYIIEPEFLKEIPDNTFIHITDVIQKCIEKGLNVGVYPVSENAWMDMGQLEELEKMRKRIEKK